VSVHCVNKETIIQNILELEEGEQKLLMEIITTFGGIVEGADGIDEEGEGEIDVDDDHQERGGLTQTNLHDETESLKRMETTSALVVQLQEKVHQLEKEKAEMQARYEKLRKEQKETEVENQRIQSEMEAALASKKQEIDAAVAEATLKATTTKQTVALQSQRSLEKAGRQQEELEAEVRELKVQLESGKRKNASEIGEAKTTIRKLQDELDLANSKLKKAAQLTQKLQTYKKKAGEINELKIKLAESIDQNSTSMGKILDLEDQLKQAVEQKSKYVSMVATLQNQVTDLKISNEESQTEITSLKEKLDEHRERIEHLNHDKETLQSEKEALEKDRSEHSLFKVLPSEVPRVSHGLDSEFLHDAVSEENKKLKQKVLLLEAENRRLKDKSGNDNELQEAIRAGEIKAKEEKVKQLQEQLKQQQQQQLDHITKLKDAHREEKKKLESEKVTKEDEVKQLKEKHESLLQSLENSKRGQDKRTDEKLEEEIKEQADKRVQQVIQAFSKENEDLQRKIKRIEDQRNQEQRLVMSAFYDIGLEYQSFLLNRNLDGGSNHTSRRSQAPKSWLNKERNKTYTQ